MLDVRRSDSYNARRIEAGELGAEEVSELLTRAHEALGISQGIDDKPTPRQVTAVTAMYQVARGLSTDGMAGPATMADVRRTDSDTATFGPLYAHPATIKDLVRVLGEAGSRGSDFERRRIVYCVDAPGQSPPLPGQMPKRWLGLHEYVMPHAREAMRRAIAACPELSTRYPGGIVMGGYVYRHMRHDPSRPLSVHSWGAAIDIAPEDNRAVTFRSLADVPEPWSEGWYRVWPHALPRGLVEAFESCGFRWGGRFPSVRDPFCDPMHFEWVGGYR